jgi:pantothenate synthetase
MAEVLAGEPAAEVEYAEVVDADSFQPLDRLPESGTVVLPVAAWVGGVRLIDNFRIEL